MGALEAPQDRHGQDHRTGTSRAEQITEAMAKLGALEAMAVQGAQEAMAVQGAQEAMAVQGAQEAMAVQGAQEAMAAGLSWPWPRPLARPLQPEPFYPPQKKIPGEVRGYQEPSGARQTGQYMTGQDSPPGPDRQDKTSHRNRKPSWAS